MSRQVLFSLHDVAPVHLERIKRAEDVLYTAGVSKIAYLLVPDFHGATPSHQFQDFKEWCRKQRPGNIDWCLHGYYHLERSEPENVAGRETAGFTSMGNWWKRRFLTAGEGEFLALNPESMMRRVQAGAEIFSGCLGYEPSRFVAPAWLFNTGLFPVLRKKGFAYTEDHSAIYDLQKKRSLKSPVITWATRTLMRKYGSLLACPLLRRIWKEKRILRIAVHPHDFDHPITVGNIRRLVGAVLKERKQALYEDLDWAEAIPQADFR